ncbi:putative F420-0 ABC transporter substrate-binding protein [Schumannella sp. 10F1B-5-1]|uniref:putative F420-0 ABC transporter substrate-binding protein n=1 Tax=Schumannella sp. 10F1B-5-1 TaxID=2590780 RepID=UPI001131DC1B|nr:putative F420-0 ABC transporter substrate-binding protein [Schumannella sp. 10F1B-5-1]TPW72300.1 putative F420-0 ABC transporter substrate-binding protein [Schumannella sp. 10F1B-5-1]
MPAASALTAVTVAATTLSLLTGCASSGATASSSTSPDSSASAAAVTLDNCGFDETIAAPPQRVITVKSTSTEMMLALGVGDRIVGTAFQDGAVPSKWKKDAPERNDVSDQMPSPESVLDLEPDLVYSGWESAFSADAAGTRDELQQLGIASYVQPAACRSQGAPAKLGFDDVFSEIDEAGRIFGVESTATKLVAAQKKQLAGIQPDDRGLTALWYSSGTDTPYVGGGTGAPEMVLEAVGLGNVAGDVKQTWTSLGWESIVDADPDVIVLIDADWNTAKSKIEQLETNPATANLSAVKNHRYLTLPFAASEAGVRSVEAAGSLATQLAKLEF